MEQPADLAVVFMATKSGDKKCKEHLDQINHLLNSGYELYGDPIALSGDRIAYNLLRPEIKPFINKDTAYPSSKQLGYIRWAYNVQESVVLSMQLTKRECSQLIEHHKERLNGHQSKEKVFLRKLKEIRGEKEEPLKPKEDDQYDDDIPF